MQSKVASRGTLRGEDRSIILVSTLTISAARCLRNSGSPLPVLEGHGMGDAPESLAYVRSWTLALELGHRVNFCCCDCGPQYPLWEMAWQGFLALRWL